MLNEPVASPGWMASANLRAIPIFRSVGLWMLITVRYRPGANASPKPTSPPNVHKVFTAYWNLVATCCCAYQDCIAPPRAARGHKGGVTKRKPPAETEMYACPPSKPARNELSGRPHLPRRPPPRERSARARTSQWQDIADAVADVYTPKLG